VTTPATHEPAQEYADVQRQPISPPAAATGSMSYSSQPAGRSTPGRWSSWT